jgi:hypothetical protein
VTDRTTESHAYVPVLLGSRRCSLSPIPGDLRALWVDGRSGRASWARLDAIHHPDDHHDQADDPENEPDHSSHFYLLFPISDVPSRRCGARLRLVVCYQPVLPYEPSRERRSAVGELRYPYDPRGVARDAVVGLSPAGLLEARRVKMIGMPTGSRPGVAQMMSAITKNHKKIDAMTVISLVAANACRRLVTGSADSSRRWSRVLLLFPEAL